MAVCRASCALNATSLSRLLRNRHCQSLPIVRLGVAGGDVYRRRPQQVGAPNEKEHNMSEKMEAVATSEAPAALGAYSQAVKANGFVFVSGQLGIDPATGELAGETAGEQAAQALKNIKHILDTAGTGIEHVCRATIYLKRGERGVVPRHVPGNVALESLGGGPCHNRDHGIQRKTVAAFGRKPAE